MTQFLADLYPTKVSYNPTSITDVTTDQTPATSALNSMLAYTQSTAADRTVTLPSVGSSEDKKWLSIVNNSDYIITITASDSDTIGWPALSIASAEILPNTYVVVQYKHSNAKWMIAEKTGNQCRPSGTALYLPMNRLGIYPASGANTTVKDATGQHLGYGETDGVNVSNTTYKFTASYDFDGSDGHITFQDSPDWDLFSSQSGDVTMCGWIYCDDAVGANQDFMTQREDAGNRWYFRRNTSGNLAMRYNTGGSIEIDIVGGTLSQSTWHHVALVKKGAETGIYIDGVQVAYDATFTADTLAAQLFVGYQDGSTTEFDGKMDDWAIVYHNIFGAAPNSTPNDSFTVDTLNPLGLIL